MTRRIAPIAAILLVGVSVWLVRNHTRGDSLSADEPIHILSGYFAVASRSAIVNIEHPPLMKILSGLALVALPLEPPPPRVPMGNLFVDYGPEFFYANRVPPDAIIAAARAPFLAVLAGLLALVFVTARRRYGAAPALFAAALCALDPNLLAHAGVVHTDLGAALAFLATVLAWDAARRRPDAPRLLLAAVCLGLALTTKFSAIYLLPILLLQTLIAARRGAEATRVGGDLLRLLAVGAGALAVVIAVYAPVTARMDPADQAIVIRDKVGAVGRAPALAERVLALAKVSKPLAHYVGGLASVARQNAVGGGVTFLNGRISTEGFPQYFLVAFGVKSTLAFLAVTAAILWAVLRKAGVAAASRADSFAEEARLFLLPVVVLFLASIGTTYNIGIRHLLPVYPFLALFGAALFARVWERRRVSGRARLAAAVWVALPVVSAVELARIHPHELSYFNPLAGGPVGGSRILSDSNVDWGLDLIRLAEELKRRGVSNPTVAYFGGDRVDYRLGVPVVPGGSGRSGEARGDVGVPANRGPRVLCVSWRHGIGGRAAGASAEGRVGPPRGPGRLLDRPVRAAAGRQPLKLSVVMPVYNEASTVREIVRRVGEVPLEKEILIIDDGSSDGTREVLRDLDGKDGVRVFLQPVNQGKGAAVAVGFRYATGDVVVVQDADLEYDPMEYLKLLAPITQGHADVVYGSRFLGGGARRVLYFWHTVGNRFLTLVSNMFTNLNLTDMETCYKMFRREVVQSIRIESQRFGIEPEITAKIARRGYRVFEVPISYYGRTYEEGKKIGWKDAFSALWTIIAPLAARGRGSQERRPRDPDADGQAGALQPLARRPLQALRRERACSRSAPGSAT